MDAEVVAALVAGAVAIASAVLGIRNDRRLRMLDERAGKEERIREELLRWANPVLDAVESLESRLDNILNKSLYQALQKDLKDRRVKPDWAVSYDYVFPTTLFLFANYFAWIRLLQERLSYELFESEQVEKRFFDALWEVSKTLSDWPRTGVLGGGHDTQVFAVQQRAIGEAVIRRDTEPPRPMTIPEFLSAYDNKDEPTFNAILEPLRELVEGLERETKRWARLSLTLTELRAFRERCRELLKLREPSPDRARS